MIAHLVFLLIGLAAVYADPPETNAEGPFPKCDRSLLQAFAIYIEGAGSPGNILKLPGTYKVLQSTTTKVYEKAKCRKYSFDPLTGIKSDVDGVLKNITAKVDDAEDAFIRLPRSNLLSVMANRGVIVTYQCSTKGPEISKDNQGDACILVNEDANSNAIKQAKGLLALLGFALTKKYDC